MCFVPCVVCVVCVLCELGVVCVDVFSWCFVYFLPFFNLALILLCVVLCCTVPSHSQVTMAMASGDVACSMLHT